MYSQSLPGLIFAAEFPPAEHKFIQRTHLSLIHISRELFREKLHPYTKALLSAVPVPDIHMKKQRILLHGELTSPIDPKPGCRFAARCPYAKEVCSRKEPVFEEVREEHFVACHFVREINHM